MVNILSRPDINITSLKQVTRLHCFKTSVVLRCVQLETVSLFPTIIMDIQTLLHNLHEEVSCSVCMTKFTDPKQLPCLHSFCLHCLQRIQQTSGIRETISCPECRQNFRIPRDGDLNALPTNFRLNSLLDVLAIKECNTSGVKCGNCDKRSGESYYCFQCCSFWCDDCISLHNGIRANKEHHTLALKDFQDEDFENILKQPPFCGKPGHEKKELEFFCNVCRVVICTSCALTDHDGHAKKPLESAANERKLRVKSAIESQQRRAQEKMNKLTELDENCVKVQEQAARVKSDVQQFVDSVFAVIEAKSMKIFDDVENNVKESLERLGMQRQEIEQQLKMHETTIEKSKILLNRSTSAQVMQANEFLDKLFQEEGDQDDTADRDGGISFPVEFHFVKRQQFFDHVNTGKIGSLQFITMTSQEQSTAEGKGIREATVGLEAQIVVTTRNAQGEQCYEERDCVTVEIRNRQGHDCATKAQVQDNKNGTYDIRYFAKETVPCQASVEVNGEHVRGSPFEVQVKPRQFRPVLSFGQQGTSAGMFSNPWGIAVNEKNEIAVTETDNHRIQVFSSNGTHLGSFGKKGDQRGELNFATGIAFHNDSIIVGDTSNHRIQLFSYQGEFLGQFGGQGNLDHQLKRPLGLSIDSDGNIIVADSDNKLIKIFSRDGQFLRKIGTEGSFIRPIHCIQHENYLVVSDFGDYCVKVFSREGNFLYKFGQKGDGDGEFNSSECLSVNKAGQLLVCDTGNHRIQVFELSGKFVTKFGTLGCKTGELNVPVSTAILSDGKIVASDFCNHRVQIFE